MKGRSTDRATAAGEDVTGPEDGSADGGSPGWGRRLAEWVVILASALVVALVIQRFVIQTFFIPSLSMLPTLDDGDRVLVNKLSYDVHDVRRGDLVVFIRPDEAIPGGTRDLIKRVVATEGETVEGRDGQVFVDSEALDEPYLDDGTTTRNLDRETVPPDHVFVMGDNRDDSRDSRVFGPVDEDDIVGRAFVRIWPLDDVGFL